VIESKPIVLGWVTTRVRMVRKNLATRIHVFPTDRANRPSPTNLHANDLSRRRLIPKQLLHNRGHNIMCLVFISNFCVKCKMYPPGFYGHNSFKQLYYCYRYYCKLIVNKVNEINNSINCTLPIFIVQIILICTVKLFL